MRVLIVEDDIFMSELIKTILMAIVPSLKCQVAETLASAFYAVESHHIDLALVDWNLPDGTGLDFVKWLREKGHHTNIVMVTGRSDRDAVISAAKYRILGYISKPFSVEVLHQRLRELLCSMKSSDNIAPDIQAHLRNILETSVQLPSSLDTQQVLELIANKDSLSARQLESNWSSNASLSARLLSVANRSTFKRSGEPVSTLTAAIGQLGVGLSLNLALALSLDMSGVFRDSRLQSAADNFQQIAESVAAEAQRIAHNCGKEPSQFYCAGLLSRAGELSVLKALQMYLDSSQELGDEQINQLVVEWASGYGNRLKQQWQLPSGLRNMIGAVHQLPAVTTSQELIIMRAAALFAAGDSASEEALRLMSRLNLR
ncbi:MAG: response regulator [Pseudohongiella sp.]|nr:response regulator [Pseudohongiella sp.]